MAKRADITPEVCRQLLGYDPETGILTWLPRTRLEMMGPDRASQLRIDQWNSAFAWTRALNGNHGKYYHGTLWRVGLYAHRVAWAIHYGEWPQEQIDHLNGDGFDNRIANLRVCSPSMNSRNTRRGLRPPAFSGITGVTRNGKRWDARITVAGQFKYLGTFATKGEARRARERAERDNGFTVRHGR